VGLGIAWGCGGQLRAQDPTVDHLSAIRIAGNRAIATAALEPALALHEAIADRAAIDPYLLTLDTERIRAAYLKRGFFDAKVTVRLEPAGRPADGAAGGADSGSAGGAGSGSASGAGSGAAGGADSGSDRGRGGARGEAPGNPPADPRGQVAVFTVVEGRRATTQVEIAGLPPELAPERARALVALDDGAPFDYDLYDAAKQPLRALVEDAGYAHVDVRARVDADPAAAVARVRYEIVPGVRCTFGAIRFTGAAGGALLDAVRARLRFATGDRYSAAALRDSQVEIYEIGRFAMVQVIADRSGGGAIVDVAVELSEANRHEVHGGFGFGFEPATYEPRVRGGGSYVPAALPLLTLGADARVAYTVPNSLELGKPELKTRAVVSAQYLDLFRPRLRGEAEVGADYQTVEAYTWTGEHVRLGLASPLGVPWLSLHIGWVLEHLSFSSLDPVLLSQWVASCDPLATDCETAAQALGLDHPQLRGAYQASLVADLRDSALDPHRGVYLGLPVTAGTPLAGGDLTYLQLTPELRGYLALAGTVIAARVRVGAIRGDVPVTERYYSGGTSGQRGYSDRQLSPKVTSIDGSASRVVGGAALFETGLELRRPLGTLWAVPLGGNLFLDGGDVTRTVDELDPRHLSWAIGAGLWTRVGGPGGIKIRVDVGYRLNRQDSGTLANFTPHLGIGEAY